MFNTNLFYKEDEEYKKTQDKEEEGQTSTVNKINDFFKLPIYYNEKKVELKQNLINKFANQTNQPKPLITRG